MIFKNSKFYDVLKWCCLSLVPALILFFTGVLPLYGVTPEVVNIVIGTLSGLGTLIGTLIGVSSVVYKKKSDQEA